MKSWFGTPYPPIAHRLRSSLAQACPILAHACPSLSQAWAMNLGCLGWFYTCAAARRRHTVWPLTGLPCTPGVPLAVLIISSGFTVVPVVLASKSAVLGGYGHPWPAAPDSSVTVGGIKRLWTVVTKVKGTFPHGRLSPPQQICLSMTQLNWPVFQL